MLALLIDLGWKSALIAGFALIANQALRRRPSAERVASLRAALAALLLLPLLSLVVPELELALLPAIEAIPVTRSVMPDAGAAAQIPTVSSFDALTLLYLAGAGLLLLRLAVGLLTLGRWTRLAAPVRDPRWTAAVDAMRLRRPVRLLVSPRIAAPLSWGISPAWVLIGRATEQRVEQAEAVIAHELAHVRRFDWPVMIAAQLATLLFWFNPLVWLMARELARQTELAADEAAIAHVARIDYAQTLLALAGSAAHPAGCGMAIRHSALGRRILHVLEADPARPASRWLCAAMLVCTPLAAAPLAATQLVPMPPPAPSPILAQPAVGRLPAPPAPASLPVPLIAKVPAVERPPSYPRRTAPPRVPRADDSIARLPRAPEPAEPREPVATPIAPAPPPPPAPGTEAFAWREALGENRVKFSARARKVDIRQIQAAVRDRRSEHRDLALAMENTARKMRHNAEALERTAADPGTAKALREASAGSASALRQQAEQFDNEARRERMRP